MAFIENDSKRRSTFMVRKKGLVKKISELSTLCGIDACIVVHSPYDADVEVWPSSIGAQSVMAQFKNMPEAEQAKKMVNQEMFLNQRIMKAKKKLQKQQKKNNETWQSHVMFQCLFGRMSCEYLSSRDLADLGSTIHSYVKQIAQRSESLRSSSSSTSITENAVSIVPSESNNNEVIVTQQQTNMIPAISQDLSLDAMQDQQWLVDIMNPQENDIGFNGDDMVLPFGDPEHYVRWSDGRSLK